MKIFRTVSTRSSENARELYNDGVKALQSCDHYEADELLRAAAEMKHPSALFNLSLLHGSGWISPYDIDFAAECLLKAAELGHAQAALEVPYIVASDQGSLGAIYLEDRALKTVPLNELNAFLMILACRYYKAVCDIHEATEEWLFWEFGVLSRMKSPHVQSFLSRIGVSASEVAPANFQLEAGSYVEAIATFSHQFFQAMKAAGNSDRSCILARCTLVGYVASHSEFEEFHHPLLGADTFFS